jgi:peptidoglycan-associated lipoprotein
VDPDGRGGGAGAGAISGVAPVTAARSDASVAAATEAKLVYFDYDSFVIKPEFQSVIESNARFLLADRKRRLVIEGHTDERGGREYNLALGQKRAEAVRQALSLLGVEDAQIEAVSFGKEKPAVLGSDEAAMAKNRRAELRIR